ncbi:hypothetical protein FAES_2643 [Fibrella aestuarina BUZ 2]|uniref:Uncharacterized protein n=1 Tax=Fibrella aestuarina BUZ 2 TaxID=1166018 RepID=I0K949_9BACT|nr:hypothetical protein FAES_2643 [Fibrella aestuarina BUZ 2]
MAFMGESFRNGQDYVEPGAGISFDNSLPSTN